jgi:hypothetical protein
MAGRFIGNAFFGEFRCLYGMPRLRNACASERSVCYKMAGYPYGMPRFT